MAFTSVVFDLDGTLIDSSPDIARALNRTFADAKLAVRELTESEVLAMLGGGPRILVAHALEALGVTASDDEIAGLVDAYSVNYRADPFSKTVFFADAAAGLAALGEQGIALGICTNKRTDIARQVLDHLGVLHLFGAVVGSDLATVPKPDRAHLDDTLAQLDVTADETLYVGDTDIDRRTAEAAGLRYAHVTWGHSDVTADVTIGSFAELLPLTR